MVSHYNRLIILEIYINRRQATIRRIQTLKKDIHNLEKNLNQSNQNSDFNHKFNLLEILKIKLEKLEETNRLTKNNRSPSSTKPSTITCSNKYKQNYRNYSE